MHTSLPLRDKSTQFINIKPLNPLVSSCDIKVLYHGKNRNRSLISRGMAEKIAATLPNVPIVGEFLEHKEDFGDHAQDMVINDEGVKFIKRTKAYGVVPADTKIWWQWFIDDDGVEREYLMCQGYLWTGRYPETLRILESGNGQSMEFDKDTLQGVWAIPENETSEYFIVSDAIFTALCILGEDVEPCFEGANIGPSTIYSLDKDKFKSEMNQFMLDLKEALNSKEGGEKMPEDEKIVNDINGENPVDNNLENPGQAVETELDENVNSNVESNEGDEFAKKKEEDEKPEEEPKEDPKENEEGKENPSEEDEDEKKKKAKYNLEEVVEYQELNANYTALEAKYNALVAEYENVKPELNSLREMKASTDMQAKEGMIKKFYMLEESDLSEVRENINNYSLDEIESKLSVLAVRKKVNFNLEETEKTDSKIEEPIVSYSTNVIDNTPAWLRVVEEIKNKK